MQVEDLTHNQEQLAQQHKIQTPPTTISEFFESEQFALASSGFLTPIVSILIDNPKLHNQLLEAMLLLETNQEGSCVCQELVLNRNSNLPFKVFDLFSNFQDVYTNYMFGYNGSSKLQNNGVELLVRMFDVFKHKQILNQTSAGYLYRILDLVLAKDDSTLLFRFLEQKPQIMENMIHHLGSPTSSNIIFKSLEAAVDEVPAENKISVIRKMFFGVVRILKDGIQQPQILIQGLKYFCQKLLDKNNIRKLGTPELSEYILDSEIVSLLCDVLKDNSVPKSVSNRCLEILILMWKQFKIQNAPKSRSSSNKSNRYFGNRLSKVKLIQPTRQSIDVLVDTVHMLLPELINLDNKTPNQRMFTTLFAELLSLMALYTTSQFKSIASLQMVYHLLKGMLLFPYNNLYHGSVKQIMLVIITDNQKVDQLITVTSQFNLIVFIQTYFTRNKSHCFESFLYQIINQIIQKIDEDHLQQRIKTINKQQEWTEVIKKYNIVKKNRQKVFQDKSDDDSSQELTTRPSESQQQEQKKSWQYKIQSLGSKGQAQAQFQFCISQKKTEQVVQKSEQKQQKYLEGYEQTSTTKSDCKQVENIFICAMNQNSQAQSQQSQC